MNYRSFMERIGSKSGKRSKSGQKFARCTDTRTEVYRYTPTECKVYQYMYRGVPVKPHQKQTCTGTCSRCTSTCVPKMPRMLCFCIIKPEFVHR